MESLPVWNQQIASFEDAVEECGKSLDNPLSVIAADCGLLQRFDAKFLRQQLDGTDLGALIKVTGDLPITDIKLNETLSLDLLNISDVASVTICSLKLSTACTPRMAARPRSVSSTLCGMSGGVGVVSRMLRPPFIREKYMRGRGKKMPRFGSRAK